MTIVLCFGTRPESLKLGVITHEMRQLGVEPYVIATGQHSDLLAGTPAEHDLKPTEALGLISQGETNTWLTKCGVKLMEVYQRIKPSLVVVQGDTMSAAAGGLAAKMLKLPIAHVEAGIRSHMQDEPYPEEHYRRKLGRWAKYHFAPTELAAANLIAEGIKREAIFVTGNPIVSALARYSDAKPVENPDPLVLITLHRRELLTKDPVLLFQIVRSIAETAGDWPKIQFLWPVHPHFLKCSDLYERPMPKNLKLSPPLTYPAMMTALSRSLGVLTDSGGLQEEAATLGTPCAVARRVSDRPESIALGLAKLFPPSPENIRAGIECLIHRELPRSPSSVYGTVQSARNIAGYLVNFGDSSVQVPASTAVN